MSQGACVVEPVELHAGGRRPGHEGAQDDPRWGHKFGYELKLLAVARRAEAEWRGR